MQANPRQGASDIISRAPNALFSQLQHLASRPSKSHIASKDHIQQPSCALPAHAQTHKRPRVTHSSDKQRERDHNAEAAHDETIAPGSKCADAASSAQAPSAQVHQSSQDGDAVTVTTISDYGVVRCRAYAEPADVAAALMECMEEAPTALRAHFREFRVGSRATLWLLTWQRWEERRAAGAFLSYASGARVFRVHASA